MYSHSQLLFLNIIFATDRHDIFGGIPSPINYIWAGPRHSAICGLVPSTVDVFSYDFLSSQLVQEGEGEDFLCVFVGHFPWHVVNC